ncbi:serine/threonine protein kinase, partial [Streptomyces tanashiensis]
PPAAGVPSGPVAPPAAAPAPAFAYAPTQGPGAPGYAAPQGPGGPAYPQQPWSGRPDQAGYRPQPPQQPKRSGGRGLVVAVAAVLAFAVAGGATAYVVLKDKDGQTSSNAGGKGSAGTQGSGGTGAGTSTRKPTTAPAPQAATYRDINLTAGYHLTLGDNDVRPQDGEDNNYELSYDTGGYLDAESSGGNLVLLDAGQEGSLEACRAETRFTQNIYVNKLSPGRQVCVTTGTGHLGLVTVKAFSPEDSPSTYLTLDLTVWRNAAPSSSSS